eukprot:XP_027304447.1 uncharacterized protein LOC113841950 [Anas platyrhynchos]
MVSTLSSSSSSQALEACRARPWLSTITAALCSLGLAQADGFDCGAPRVRGGALCPPSSRAGAAGGLAGLLCAGVVVVRGVLCLSSPGISSWGAADGAVSVVCSEPGEVLAGCSASCAASLSTLLAALPSSWGTSCASVKRLANLGLIQELMMTISSSSSHPPGLLSFLPRPWLVPSFPVPCLGLMCFSLCCFFFLPWPGLAAAGSLLEALAPAHSRESGPGRAVVRLLSMSVWTPADLIALAVLPVCARSPSAPAKADAEDVESAGSAVGGGTLGPVAEGALGALLTAPWLMATARRRTVETMVFTLSCKSSSQALEACWARPWLSTITAVLCSLGLREADGFDC